MKDIDCPPATTPRPQIVIVVLGLFLAVSIVAVGVTNAYYGLHTRNSRPLSTQNQKQLASQSAAARPQSRLKTNGSSPEMVTARSMSRT